MTPGRSSKPKVSASGDNRQKFFAAPAVFDFDGILSLIPDRHQARDSRGDHSLQREKHALKYKNPALTKVSVFRKVTHSAGNDIRIILAKLVERVDSGAR